MLADEIVVLIAENNGDRTRFSFDVSDWDTENTDLLWDLIKGNVNATRSDRNIEYAYVDNSHGEIVDYTKQIYTK